MFEKITGQNSLLIMRDEVFQAFPLEIARCFLGNPGDFREVIHTGEMV